MKKMHLKSKNIMRGAEILVKTLERYGVSYIFGLPGDTTAFFRALKKSPIRFITMRDERGAGFAADAYGRLSGEPGVVYVSRGPGGTNAVSGMASSYLDGSPTIFIADQVERGVMFPRAHMGIELEKLFSSVSKGAEVARSAKDIPAIFFRAWQDANAHPQGPRCMVVPLDVLDEEAKYKFVFHAPQKLRDEFRNAASRLRYHLQRSKHPIVIFGPDVVPHAVSREFKAFLKALPIPVFTNRAAKGAIAINHPRHFGIMSDACQKFSDTDLAVTIGFDVTDKPVTYHWMRNQKNITHINIATFPFPILKWFSPTEEYVVDLKRFFAYAAGELAGQTIGDFPLPCQAIEWRETIRQDTYKEWGGSLLFNFLGEKYLGSMLSPDDVFISDTGIHKTLAMFAYDAPGPNMVFSVGLSAVGFAIPASVGASLAKPKARVISLCGDGGFLMAVSELETIRRLNLPVKIVVVADGAYGLIKYRQNKSFGSHVGVDFTNPDFSHIAAAFGFQYVAVRSEKDLPKARFAIISSRQPSIIVLYDKYRYK